MRSPRPYDIWFARVTWKGCTDERPWLVIDLRPGGLAGCFPLSGQRYNETDCFALDPSDPDFAATGLSRACFIHYRSLIDVPMAEFVRYKGRMEGELRRRFIDVAGLEGY